MKGKCQCGPVCKQQPSEVFQHDCDYQICVSEFSSVDSVVDRPEGLESGRPTRKELLQLSK